MTRRLRRVVKIIIILLLLQILAAIPEKEICSFASASMVDVGNGTLLP
jgi:hypothetical protein